MVIDFTLREVKVNMPVLRVHRGESTVHLELPKGVTLLEALKSSGFAHEVESPCGGLGLCGGCSVRALGGLSDRSPREALLPGGVRLACVARLLGDAEVFLDDLSSPVLSTTNGLDSLDFTIAPPCRAVPFRLDLRRDLMAGCSSLEEFLVRACSVLPYPLEGVLDVALEGLARMLSRREGEALAWVFDRRIVMVGHVGLTPLGLAVDLGSSTIEVAAADLCSGEVLGRLRVENRQRRLGVDVVTRITRALEGFSDELWRLLVSSLDEAVKELLKSLGASADRVVRIVVGCNTVMGGFLFKIPPAGLSERPFLPWTLRSRTVEALGLGVNLRCPLTLLPSIGGFVGSDALAFLYRHKGEGVRLLLDLGTNGEVLLWTPEEALGASTAAGPAFEGYGLSCGMPALPGAVHRVRLEDGDVKLDVIGGSAPKGVCGSGLVSSVSLMRGTGILDGSGRMDPSRDFKFQLGAGASLWITQRDVREFQLAKGAVRAAVETLLDEAGVGESQVDLCVVSGLFGGSLQVEDLIRVGMLPSRWKDRVRFSPHGVLEGLLSVLFGGEDALREVEELALRCRHVSLDRDDFKNRLLRCLDLGESDPV
ncbi:MAG: ASKHA domain-containing protein [Thermanaerothrix sp.]|nr:ASKHA domain-containing protein [Thermanaerothrix sp.]